MNNEQINSKAEELAARVREVAAAGETPEDLYRLVLVNVTTLLRESGAPRGEAGGRAGPQVSPQSPETTSAPRVTTYTCDCPDEQAEVCDSFEKNTGRRSTLCRRQVIANCDHRRGIDDEGRCVMCSETIEPQNGPELPTNNSQVTK